MEVSRLLSEYKEISEYNNQLIDEIDRKMVFREQINQCKIQLLESLVGDKKLI